MRKKIQWLVEQKWFQNFVLVVVFFNAASLGVQTFKLSPNVTHALAIMDTVCLVIFCVEIVLKLIAYGWRFFKDGWNDFDFLVVAIALVPNMGALSALRMLRVLRVLRSLRALRIVSRLKKLRVIIQALGQSLPSIGWTGLLLVIIFYIFAVVGSQLFGSTFPDWFGDLGKSLYTLFQVMTMESWSMGISRPVMEVFPLAWAYFIPFILISAFVIMNVVVGVVVNTISEVSENDKKEDLELSGATLQIEMNKLKEQFNTVQRLIEMEQSQLAKQKEQAQDEAKPSLPV